MSGNYSISAHLDPEATIASISGKNFVGVDVGEIRIVVGHRHGEEGVAWLRRLAVACEEAAEQQELACGLRPGASVNVTYFPLPGGGGAA